MYANGSATLGSNLAASSKDETPVPPDSAIQGLAVNLREALTRVHKETGTGASVPQKGTDKRSGSVLQWNTTQCLVDELGSRYWYE